MPRKRTPEERVRWDFETMAWPRESIEESLADLDAALADARNAGRRDEWLRKDDQDPRWCHDPDCSLLKKGVWGHPVSSHETVPDIRSKLLEARWPRDRRFIEVTLEGEIGGLTVGEHADIEGDVVTGPISGTITSVSWAGGVTRITLRVSDDD